MPTTYVILPARRFDAVARAKTPAGFAEFYELVHDKPFKPPAYCPGCGKPNYYVGSCGYCGKKYTIKHGGV